MKKCIVFEIKQCKAIGPKRQIFSTMPHQLNAMRMLSYCIFPVIPCANKFLGFNNLIIAIGNALECILIIKFDSSNLQTDFKRLKFQLLKNSKDFIQ